MDYEDLFVDPEEELDLLDYIPDTPPPPPILYELEQELPAGARDRDEEDGGNCHIEDPAKDICEVEIAHKPSDDHIILSMPNGEGGPRRLDDDEHSQFSISPTNSIGPPAMEMDGLHETPPSRLQPRTSWRDYTTLQVAAEPQGIFRHSNRPEVGRAKGNPLFQRYKGAPGEIRGRRQPTSTVTSSHQSQLVRNEKLKQGLRSLVQTDYPSFGSIAASFALANTGTPVDPNVPAWEPDPWQCVKRLMKQGYEIRWTMFQLKYANKENQTHMERLHKCVIVYQEITGVCEARKGYLARLGAASEFLEKLCKQMPQVGKLNTVISTVSLVNPGISWEFMERHMEKKGFKPLFEPAYSTFAVNSRNVHKYELRIGPVVYTDYSHFNMKLAIAGAWKQAYEALLMEPYPLLKIFVGEDCIMDASFYEKTEDERTPFSGFRQAHHGHELSPETIRGYYKARHSGPLIVSYDNCAPTE